MKVRMLLTVAVSLFVAVSISHAVSITFTQISTPFNSPIGIDHHEPTNQVALSVNYSNGLPHNFELVAADGTHAQFSAASGQTDEVKIATVRSGGIGGFATGELFTGNGVAGEIVRISPTGATILDPWVSLPGGDGLLRGSLYVDRTGVYGGDLIVVTTGGQVWRVTSAGTPTLLADANTHLEGVITVPNNPVKYGPLAGKIIAGAENSGGLLYAFDATGNVTTHNVGVDIEDIDLIVANENFFGVNFGTSRLLGAPASEFAGIVDDILLTQEFGGVSGLFRLFWDGANLQTEALTLGAGSAAVGQWEHVTFSPAGIVEIPTTVIPEPLTMGAVLMGIAQLGRYMRKRGKAL